MGGLFRNMNRNAAKMNEYMDLLQINNSSAVSIKQQLTSGKDRFDQFSRSFGGLLLDFSRTTIDQACFETLIGLAEACGIDAMRQRMYGGEHINFTEDRAVLHPVWRERNFSELLPGPEAEMLSAATVRIKNGC